MAQLIIDIPDAAVPKLRDSFASAYGWTPTVPNPNAGQPIAGTDPVQLEPATVPNPETKGQHFRRKVAEYIREVHRGERAKAAALAAQTAATQEADADNTGVQ
jgi:hypothetical protein